MNRPSSRFPIWLILLILMLAACEFPVNDDPPPPTEPAETTAAPEATELPPSPTSPPPTPTRPATATPQPLPTADPGLADWTILVYLDADNSLEQSGLRDLNEMEAAGGSDQVNVLVQMDRALDESDAAEEWTGARRYRVTADKDPDQVASELLASLDEVNMGDPQVLADFLAWGVTNYPANHYGLVLWDHGAGWNGIAFDSDVGFSDQVDHISLPDLDQALAGGLAGTNRARLDLIAFDACLMGQLDVLQAIQPYAAFAVASEELTPGQGWDYEQVLRRLYDRPDQDGAALARQMVDDFAQNDADDFVTMAAVELARLPDLTYAVEQLASALSADPAFVASAVADARSGAEAYAREYADEFEQYAAIDLSHFASILAQRSVDEQVSQAAERVMDAAAAAVIHNRTGSGFRNSEGIAIYFPRTGEFYAPAYGQVTTMSGWDDFLRGYHQSSLAELPPPQLSLSRPVSATIGAQAPLYLEFEIIGREIAQVALVGGRYLDDGQALLLEYDHLIPEPTYLADGSRLVEWRDGLHEDFFIWDTQVTYLFDADGNGDFVVMWPARKDSDNGDSLFTVQGRYRRADSSNYVEANLVFDHRRGQLVRMWSLQGGAAAELSPQPGDEFQLSSFFRSAEGSLDSEPGPSLFFDEQAQLYFDWRPLPDGAYFLGFVVENAAGQKAEALVDVMVENTGNQPGSSAYLDPYFGFQFNYPESWFRPVYDGTLLYTTNLSGTTQLQITAFPNLKRSENAVSLQRQALAQYGPIELLYPAENIIIGGTTGLRTSYGYQKPDGELRTGIFLTFVVDGTGFVVDMDGPMAEEATTIAAVNNLVDSWHFSPARFGLYPGDWATIDLDAFSVAQPADFRYQEVNGWQRFSSGSRTFVALRGRPATLDATASLQALNQDAASGVTDFTHQEPLQISLAGTAWLRSDFSYMAGNEEIWGFIMVSIQDGQEIVAWAEAPADKYNQLESDIFLMMIADLTLAN